MALTESDIQDLITAEVGGNIPDAEVPLDVSKYWDLNAMYALQPRVRMAQTKLDSIRFLLGQLRYLTNAGIADLNPQLHVRFRNLQAMEKMTEDDLQRWRDYYQKQRGSVISTITAENPYEQDDIFGPNPNARRLRGDANQPPYYNAGGGF